MSVACVFSEKSGLDSFLSLEIGVDTGFPFGGKEEWRIVKLDEERAVCRGCGEKVGDVEAGSLDIEVGVGHCEVLSLGFWRSYSVDSTELWGFEKDAAIDNIYS